MATKHETVQVWGIVDHICRCCFGRVLMRQGDGVKVYKCSCCGIEAEGRTEAVICTCGIKLKTGADAGIRCHESTNKTPEFPAQITASQLPLHRL